MLEIKNKDNNEGPVWIRMFYNNDFIVMLSLETKNHCVFITL